MESANKVDKKYCRKCRNDLPISLFMDEGKEWKMCNRCRLMVRESKRKKVAKSIGQEYKPDDNIFTKKKRGVKLGACRRGTIYQTSSPQDIIDFIDINFKATRGNLILTEKRGNRIISIAVTITEEEV